MRAFHDWEFLEDGKTIVPISVGLVAADNREYYAVNRHLPQARVWNHQWLKANVVPALPLLPNPMPTDWLDHDHPDVKPLNVIRDDILEFLHTVPDLELWGWYSAYDHVCLAQLFGPMSHLPAGIPMWTNDLRQEAHRLGVPDDAMPAQPDGHHNALSDARHNKTMSGFLDQVAAAPTTN